MVFEDVLLLPKPCSTKNAPRRSEGRIPGGRCTTPESLSPAEGKVTGCSVIGVFSVIGSPPTHPATVRSRDDKSARAASAVCSPPPCGEGLGVGGRHRITARPPPRRFAPTLPTRRSVRPCLVPQLTPLRSTRRLRLSACRGPAPSRRA